MEWFGGNNGIRISWPSRIRSWQQEKKKIRAGSEDDLSERPNLFAIGQEEKQERQQGAADGELEERRSQQPGLVKGKKDQSRSAD